MLSTEHLLYFRDSANLCPIESEGIDLVVTSPPYPMIEMWDQLFIHQDREIGKALERGDAPGAFELMHLQLDKVWTELFRVLKQGGIACVNIGDATRSVSGKFSLLPNHSRILWKFLDLGFEVLPMILWRKQTNAPNKFMGSGMLPVGAYVTLEHEYILIMRKSGLRGYRGESEKALRRRSAYFWEERNRWFSDVWDFKGVRQDLDFKSSRTRSAAFPFELAFRCISMYSLQGDTILDPFMGTGTAIIAAMTACRNSIGFEIDESLRKTISSRIEGIKPRANEYLARRIQSHIEYMRERNDDGKKSYHNQYHQFEVVTAQERELKIHALDSVISTGDKFICKYSDEDRQPSF